MVTFQTSNGLVCHLPKSTQGLNARAKTQQTERKNSWNSQRKCLVVNFDIVFQQENDIISYFICWLYLLYNGSEKTNFIPNQSVENFKIMQYSTYQNCSIFSAIIEEFNETTNLLQGFRLHQVYCFNIRQHSATGAILSLCICLHSTSPYLYI